MTEIAVNEPSKSTDLNALRRAVEDMDELTQGGLSEISAIAMLALQALQSPEGYLFPENIVQALKVIRSRAEDVENCVNVIAEEVGCNYRDEALRRRMDARRFAREKKEIPDPIDTAVAVPETKLVH